MHFRASSWGFGEGHLGERACGFGERAWDFGKVCWDLLEGRDFGESCWHLIELEGRHLGERC